MRKENLDLDKNGKPVKDILREELQDIKYEAHQRGNQLIIDLTHHAIGMLDQGNVLKALKARGSILERTRDWDV